MAQLVPFSLSVMILPLVWGLTEQAVAQTTRGIELSLTGDEAAGYVSLAWSLARQPTTVGKPEFQVEQATDPRFEDAQIRYQGSHHASFFSGLTNGEYYFRVRARHSQSAPWLTWSEPARFRVEHHSLATAGILFSLGALVFVATGLVLLRENRKRP